MPDLLVHALLEHHVLTGGRANPRVIETHISWVILTGELAYKIKKPVNLGFVDFSTLEARRQACLEELRLNRRLVPELYLDVLTIHGSREHPTLAKNGPVIEYAVKMRQFPPRSATADSIVGQLTAREMDELAVLLAGFHRGLPGSPPDPRFGLPDQIWCPAADSLAQLGALLSDAAGRSDIERVRVFLEAEMRRNRDLMERRHAAGAVRECHGDLHLGNLVRLDDRLVPFDALEFDPALRWIDVLNEVAFLVMDLGHHGRRDLAFRFLNRYLDATGDHEGLPVVPFYLGYRALVRAKVRAMAPPGLTSATRQTVDRLLAEAADPHAGAAALLVLMCGVSGTGKSWIAERLAERLGAIHVRSDVERKRLFGFEALDRTASAAETGIYDPQASAHTYRRLCAIAACSLSCGFPVIVDATNLRREHRAPFLTAARDAGCPAAILVCQADRATIEHRVSRRLAAGQDPSEARMEIVDRQRRLMERPGLSEADLVWFIETAKFKETGELADRLRKLRFE
jgi:aminoglycoside phosphotransferase family enzyme/predicted kinase